MGKEDRAPSEKHEEMDLDLFEESKKGGAGAWWFALAVLAVLVAAGLYVLLPRTGKAPGPDPAGPPSPVRPAGIAAPADEKAPAAEPGASATSLPPLADSDGLVRSYLAALSGDARLAGWLAGDDLVRRFVVVTDNVAEGLSPARHLPFLAPSEPFLVEEVRGRLMVAPRSYRRYDPLAEVFASLDIDGCARTFRTLQPLFEEAYRDLGYEERPFARTFELAVDRLLGTPVPSVDVEVIRSDEGSYLYADEALEGLSGAEKHFLRMGPANMRTIQKALRRLAAALGQG